MKYPFKGFLKGYYFIVEYRKRILDYSQRPNTHNAIIKFFKPSKPLTLGFILGTGLRSAYIMAVEEHKEREKSFSFDHIQYYCIIQYYSHYCIFESSSFVSFVPYSVK